MAALSRTITNWTITLNGNVERWSNAAFASYSLTHARSCWGTFANIRNMTRMSGSGNHTGANADAVSLCRELWLITSSGNAARFSSATRAENNTIYAHTWPNTGEIIRPTKQPRINWGEWSVQQCFLWICKYIHCLQNPNAIIKQQQIQIMFFLNHVPTKRLFKKNPWVFGFFWVFPNYVKNILWVYF